VKRKEIDMQITSNAETVREKVRAGYADIALHGSDRRKSSCCCGMSEVDSEALARQIGYSAEELAELPGGANIGLSCGNPSAVAALRPGEVLLDLGSGAGFDAFVAAPKVGSTGRVIGVDMTAEMLARARQNVAAYRERTGLDNVEFRLGEIEHLPVADTSVDVIISNCVINLAEDKAKVFAEAYRALKDEGRLEVNDVVFGGPVLPEVRISALGWSECVSGALPEAEYVDLVKQAGFKDIRVRRSTSEGVSNDVAVYSVQISARK